MTTLHKGIRLAGLIAGMLSFGSMAHAESAPGSTLPDDALVEPGRFTFAASGEFRPFSYVDDEQRLAGFDIEVGEAIAHVLGLVPDPKKYKFAAIVEGVKTGRFDAAVASHTITTERLAHVDFSTPYYYSGPQIFVRPESALSDSNDVRGAEIAVSKGSTYARMAENFTDQIKVYDSDVTALEALAAGRHDAVITDFITGRMAIQEGIDVDGRQLLGRSEQAIAVAKGNSALLGAIDRALEALRENGELARISNAYFGDDITVDPGGTGGTRAEVAAADDANPIVHFFRVLVESRDVFVRAALLTVQLTIVAILFGCIIGLLFAFAKLSRVPPLEWIANGYIYLVRGTPLIVQIFVLYFGLTDIVKISGFWAAAIALAFHNGAYIAEIFRGAIESIDRGQMEAGRSLGMSTRMTYRRVILPQAGLRALPALGNQFIIGLKDSSLAAFISINELFNVATTQGANNFDQMTFLLVVAVYYLILVLVLTLLVQWMETRLGRGRLAA
jgi:His/Glu/Gln/Arg/opine family amino acid ABC transporter permease subunit